MKKIFAANWKMHPASEREAEKLFSLLARMAQKNKYRVLLAPPSLFLSSLVSRKKKVVLGVQNGFYESEGAYTGEISFPMAKGVGARFTLVGHSERRGILNEDDAVIAKKVSAALRAGLAVILCVGESFALRKKGERATRTFLSRQLARALSHMPKGGEKNIVLAYEPVWAIGTGKNMTPREAGETISFLKQESQKHFGYVFPILYGGSVDAKNISAFFKEPLIDGALVGGASAEYKKLNALFHALS
jgi:triosephosphate isomerase